MAKKYKYTTVKKWNGDDQYSWAIFIRGQEHPVYNGLTRPEVSYYRDKVEKDQATRHAPPAQLERSAAVGDELLASLGLTTSDVVSAFQSTAEMTGGDILQCCRDQGEPEEIPRDALMDYLETYGGPKGKLVQQFCSKMPGTMDDLERYLTKIRVPLTWS